MMNKSCPRCGSLVAQAAERCPTCGYVISRSPTSPFLPADDAIEQFDTFYSVPEGIIDDDEVFDPATIRAPSPPSQPRRGLVARLIAVLTWPVRILFRRSPRPRARPAAEPAPAPQLPAYRGPIVRQPDSMPTPGRSAAPAPVAVLETLPESLDAMPDAPGPPGPDQGPFRDPIEGQEPEAGSLGAQPTESVIIPPEAELALDDAPDPAARPRNDQGPIMDKIRGQKPEPVPPNPPVPNVPEAKPKPKAMSALAGRNKPAASQPPTPPKPAAPILKPAAEPLPKPVAEPPGPAASRPPAAVPPTPQAPPPDDAQDDEVEGGKTVYFGAMARELKPRVRQKTYFLDILGPNGQWGTLAEVLERGLEIGRTEGQVTFPDSPSLATRHARFSYEDGALIVEDLGSRNGVLQRITQAVPLHDGDRFRVGNHLLQFRTFGQLPPVRPPAGPDEEELWTRDLTPHGVVALIRGDGTALCTFSMLKPETVIGRDPVHADLALIGDKASSRRHARIRHDGGAHWLEDAGSQNGTYIQIKRREPLKPGDMVLLGVLLLRVSEQASNWIASP